VFNNPTLPPCTKPNLYPWPLTLSLTIIILTVTPEIPAVTLNSNYRTPNPNLNQGQMQATVIIWGQIWEGGGRMSDHAARRAAGEKNRSLAVAGVSEEIRRRRRVPPTNTKVCDDSAGVNNLPRVVVRTLAGRRSNCMATCRFRRDKYKGLRRLRAVAQTVGGCEQLA